MSSYFQGDHEPQWLVPVPALWGCSPASTWLLLYLTCLKGDIFADVVELMGVNLQMVLGTSDQIRHSNRRLLFHWDNFHRLIALETQERGQSHSRGCGHDLATMPMLEALSDSIKVFERSDSRSVMETETGNSAGPNQSTEMVPVQYWTMLELRPWIKLNKTTKLNLNWFI